MKKYPYAETARRLTDPAAQSEFCYRAQRNPLGGPAHVLSRMRLPVIAL